MSAPREVVSLVCGPFSSFVGAHMWNFQDELLGLNATTTEVPYVDPNVLFRFGEHRGQSTCNPRALVLDMQGSLGGLSLRSGMEAESEAISSIAAQWGANAVEVHRQPAVAQSSFVEQLQRESEAAADMGADEDDEAFAALEEAARELDADEAGPRFWTDFCKATLHPNSVVQLSAPWSQGGGDGVARPLGWGEGQKLLEAAEPADDVADRLRRFAEECDRLQGLQVLVDADSAFGGVASSALTHAADDYPRLPIILFALQHSAAAPARLPGQDQAAHVLATRRWQLACALSLAHLAPLCSLFLPLAPPPGPTMGPSSPLSWRPGNRFHTSALCAAIADSISLPYRMTSQGGMGGQDLHSLANLLAARPSANITAVAAAFPAAALPAAPVSQGADARLQHTAASAAAASPFTLAGVQCWSAGLSHGDVRQSLLAESVVLRGARTQPPAPSIPPSPAAAAQSAPVGMPAAAAALDASLLSEGVRCIRHRCVSRQPLPIPLPYPRIFSPLVSRHGDVFIPPVHSLTLPNGSYPPWQNSPTTRPSENGHVHGNADVESVPVLTRLMSSQHNPELASQQLQQFRVAVRSAAGRQLWHSWDYDQQHAEDAETQLHMLASVYDDSDG